MTEALIGKQACIYIIGQTCRPNALQFLVELEHTFYHPEDEHLNDSFQVFTVKYSNALFFVAELAQPLPAPSKLNEVAEGHNLRLVSGKPFDGVDEFPANCRADACFTLEIKDYSLESR